MINFLRWCNDKFYDCIIDIDCFWFYIDSVIDELDILFYKG